MAELDPAIAPGQVVRLPGRDGVWRIDSWEWRDQGIELALIRLPRGQARQPAADPGTALTPPDLSITPTVFAACEVPWDGSGSADTRSAFAAVSSASAGWRGAALYVQQGAKLLPMGPSGRQRSVIGMTTVALPSSAGSLIDRRATVEVGLVSPDFALDSTDLAGLAGGANKVLVGDEVLQFLHAEKLHEARWRLTGLLRGRGGTEAAAMRGAPAGAAFVLLDDSPVALDPALVGESNVTIAAIGLADPEPVYAPLVNAGLTRRPLTPVHGVGRERPDGSLSLAWCRRSRGSWLWLDGVDVPLNEQAEAYLVGIGDGNAPDPRWETAVPALELEPASWSAIRAAHAGKPLWVRQIGTAAPSPPLLLTIIA